ncbi:MAG: histidine triad nucleotide-binding protein [Candidatus Melainabacteria bacterium]|nr:histidine triad nucleotide-binding protein [Candidatus Melainabacteria bacterium]
MTTVFAKIIAGQIPSKKVFENERILAIEDIAPLAPVHILIMPKKEIRNLQDVKPEDLPLIAEIVQVAQQLADEYNIEEGYRLVTNNGSEGGQAVFHLHFHLLGGRQLHHSLG